MAELEHISSILSRVFKELVQTWEVERIKDGVEKEYKAHSVDVGEVESLLEPSLDSDQSH